ncbi:hypothetical protein CK203_033484 [Vitis vinifera]|uniref:Uncharacterized protein n=1 Tax=Vitis vinifera TaxID=29760 RepID=A0A438CGT1_VITVI|nr:hypothetical protein CK203_111205 [Vitis vinifera]RVW60888.1 hypothetical protein CK203_033484 [Vitis vinifera]
MVVVQELLLSYNIAVDRSDEMKRILGKSASSVGLQLPEFHDSIIHPLNCVALWEQGLELPNALY